MRHWAESCVGSWCVSAPSLRHLGPRSLIITGILLHRDLWLLAPFLTYRVFAAAKVFTFFFQNPLLPFVNSWFWHCLLFLKDSKTLNFSMFMYRRTSCDLLPNGWFCLMCCNKFINVTLQPKWWKQENLKHGIVLILAAMKKVSSIPTTPCAFCFSLRDQREDTRNWDV